MDNLSRFPMNGLRAVSALRHHRTLSKAADKLCVSPGAVSKQVVRIEEILGQRLFDRTTNGFKATEAYESFLAELSKGFEKIDYALSMLDEYDAGELRLTVAPGLAKNWLVPRLGNFDGLGTDLRMRIDSTTDLADLQSGQFGYAIRFGTGPWPGLKATPLLKHELFPVCTPKVATQLRDIKDLENVPIIFEEDGTLNWHNWLIAAKAPRLELREGTCLSSPDLCVEAALSGLGVALAWQTMAIDALRGHELVVPFPVSMSTGQCYWLLEPEVANPEPKAREFKDWLIEQFRDSQASYDMIMARSRNGKLPCGA